MEMKWSLGICLSKNRHSQMEKFIQEIKLYCQTKRDRMVNSELADDWEEIMQVQKTNQSHPTGRRQPRKSQNARIVNLEKLLNFHKFTQQSLWSQQDYAIYKNLSNAR